MYVCMYACMYVCMYRMYVCMYVYTGRMYVCMYVYTYMYVRMYTMYVCMHIMYVCMYSMYTLLLCMEVCCSMLHTYRHANTYYFCMYVHTCIHYFFVVPNATIGTDSSPTGSKYSEITISLLSCTPQIALCVIEMQRCTSCMYQYMHHHFSIIIQQYNSIIAQFGILYIH